MGKQMEKTTAAKEQARRRPQGRKRIWAALGAALAAGLLILGGRCLLSDELEVTFYHVHSPKTASGENIRVIVLSDLHSREFGPENQELVEQIAALRPDLIAIAGDMVNADDGSLNVVLTQLLVGGLTTSVEGYEEYGAAFFEEYERSGSFKLLIAHYPSLFYDDLADGAVDLGICGHYHGGQVRLPFVGGLYHGDTGLFPQYSGGLYQLTHGTIFVSRGMGGHNGLPRVNNRPELAVIDINGRQDPGQF